MRRLILVIAVAAILAVAGWYWLGVSTRPVVQVTSFSVNPSTITSMQEAALTVGLANNDITKGHTVLLRFSSHALVSFYVGKDLLPRKGSDWELSLNMLASESRTQVLTVKAGLESGVSQITYRISMTTFVDEAQSESKYLDLTVRAP